MSAGRGTPLGRMGPALLLFATMAAPALAQVPPPPPPPPPPPFSASMAPTPVIVDATGSSVLAGTVFVDDGTSHVVRRARVMLHSTGLPDRMLLTDDGGRFTFTDLPAATFSVRADKAGWLTGYLGARESWKGPGTPVTLGDGERRTDLTLRLAHGGAIAGRLVDQFGQPLAGARVVALGRRRQGGQDTFEVAGALLNTLTQWTNDRGEFRIFGLPPGEFIVGANVLSGETSGLPMTTADEVRWAEERQRTGRAGMTPAPATGPELGHVPIFFPGVTDLTAASSIRIGVGEERDGVDFQVPLVPGATVRGMVETPDGRPAPALTVHLASTNGAIVVMPPALQPSQLRARTDADGRFAISLVAPGEYTIVARGRAMWADERVSVAGADVDGLEIRLRPGMLVSGQLVFTGSTTEATDGPKTASMAVVPVEAAGTTARIPAIQVGARGAFTLHGLPPGRYLLAATARTTSGPVRPTWVSSRAEIDGRNALEVPFEITPDRSIDDVVIEFTDRPAELSGAVTDARGRLVQGLTMVLFPADEARWVVSQDERARRTSVLDARGWYHMDALPAGEYYLAALADPSRADLADPSFLKAVSAGAVRITLSAGDQVVQNVRVGG